MLDERGSDEFTHPGPLVFIRHLVAAVATLLCLLISDAGTAMWVLGGITCAWSIPQVMRRGGSFLVPSSVYFVATTVYVGIGSMYLASLGSETEPVALRDATVVCLLTTIATGVVVSVMSVQRRIHWPRRQELGRPVGSQLIPPKQFELKGMLMVVASKTSFVAGLGPAVADALGMAGVMMLVLALASSRRRITWAGDAIWSLLALVIPVWWLSTVFTGGGRLVLAGIGIGVLVAWNLIRPHGYQKALIIVGIPAFLLFAGTSRVNYVNTMPGANVQDTTDVIGSGKGLESVYNPLDTFATMVSQKDHPGDPKVTPRYGATLVNTLVLPVPRDWWHGKPKGFGAELTASLRPDLVSVNHSMAALIQGEWYANFGWFGLIIMPLLMGWILVKLDAWHARLAARRLAEPKDWWRAVTMLCIVASLGDLAWVGTFTFFNRGGLAAVFVLVIGAFSFRRSSAPSEEAPFEPEPREPYPAGPVHPTAALWSAPPESSG